MILLKFLILVLFASLCDSDALPNYLIHATEKNGVLKFVQSDLDFGSQTDLVEIKTNGKIIDKMDLGIGQYGEFLYWSYSNSDSIERVNITTREKEEIHANPEFGKFLGAGYDDIVYFYRSDNKTFTAYNYENNEQKSHMVIANMTDIHCYFIDPFNRELLFFAECTESGKSLIKILDVGNSTVLTKELGSCFNICGMTPDGKKFYMVNGQTFGMVSMETNWSHYSTDYENIQAFVVGNNELFYTTKTGGSKINKLTDFNGTTPVTQFAVEGNVKALVIYQEYVYEEDDQTADNK